MIKGYKWRSWFDYGMGFVPDVSEWHTGLPQEKDFNIFCDYIQIIQFVEIDGNIFTKWIGEFEDWHSFSKKFGF